MATRTMNFVRGRDDQPQVDPNISAILDFMRGQQQQPQQVNPNIAALIDATRFQGRERRHIGFSNNLDSVNAFMRGGAKGITAPDTSVPSGYRTDVFGNLVPTGAAGGLNPPAGQQQAPSAPAAEPRGAQNFPFFPGVLGGLAGQDVSQSPPPAPQQATPVNSPPPAAAPPTAPGAASATNTASPETTRSGRIGQSISEVVAPILDRGPAAREAGFRGLIDDPIAYLLEGFRGLGGAVNQTAGTLANWANPSMSPGGSVDRMSEALLNRPEDFGAMGSSEFQNRLPPIPGQDGTSAPSVGTSEQPTAAAPGTGIMSFIQQFIQQQQAAEQLRRDQARAALNNPQPQTPHPLQNAENSILRLFGIE